MITAASHICNRESFVLNTDNCSCQEIAKCVFSGVLYEEITQLENTHKFNSFYSWKTLSPLKSGAISCFAYIFKIWAKYVELLSIQIVLSLLKVTSLCSHSYILTPKWKLFNAIMLHFLLPFYFIIIEGQEFINKKR